MLNHGGAIRAAAGRYGIAHEQWLDLSTGINPNGWPVPDVPAAVWQRLPEDNDGLEQAAAAYYGSAQLLPVAGSQAALQALPQLRKPCQVGVLTPSYAEHAHAWNRHGHSIVPITAETIEACLASLDVLVLSNPNNPTGVWFSREVLLEWWSRLAKRDGWLVVDEAFIDATPERSLAPHSGPPGLVILRSLGKFFGLAGARVGFVLGPDALLQRLRELLGPWTVSGPGRWVAIQALNDRCWQRETRRSLSYASARLAELLSWQGLPVTGSTSLFQWLLYDEAAALKENLARQGIWVRYFDAPPSLRFGLPGSEAAWRRLTAALQKNSAGCLTRT